MSAGVLASRLDDYDEEGEGKDRDEGGNDEEADAVLKTSSGTTNEDGVTELIKKKQRGRKGVTPEMLVSSVGFKRVYEEFPVDCSLIEGNEAKSLSRLVEKYRFWALELHPGLSFFDFLATVEVQANKGPARTTVGELRDRERNRYMRDVLHIDLPSSSFEDVSSAAPQSVSPMHESMTVDDDDLIRLLEEESTKAFGTQQEEDAEVEDDDEPSSRIDVESSPLHSRRHRVTESPVTQTQVQTQLDDEVDLEEDAEFEM